MGFFLGKQKQPDDNGTDKVWLKETEIKQPKKPGTCVLKNKMKTEEEGKTEMKGNTRQGKKTSNYRSSNRNRLVNAYLELKAVVFRSHVGNKGWNVYKTETREYMRKEGRT